MRENIKENCLTPLSLFFKLSSKLPYLATIVLLFLKIAFYVLKMQHYFYRSVYDTLRHLKITSKIGTFGVPHIGSSGRILERLKIGMSRKESGHLATLIAIHIFNHKYMHLLEDESGFSLITLMIKI